MRICVCGGGNLGHVVTGMLAADGQNEVSLLTRKPNLWSQQLRIQTPEGSTIEGTIRHISSQPEEVVTDAELVLLCLPGFSIADELALIRQHLSPHAIVGSIVSSTGFFFEAMQILPADTPLFGFQRVPFISRTIQYGREARLMGYKPAVNICIERYDDKEGFRQTIERLFHTPTLLLDNLYEASLTNSNPLLHPARLYTLWKDWKPGIAYPVACEFYGEWTLEASDIYIRMDEEFQQLLETLPVRKGSIPTVLDYYESADALSLTRKLRSIEAFKGILAPMQKTPAGFIPDFGSRYFTEDFPYGLAIIRRLAQEHHISTPVIDEVYAWGIAPRQAYSQ